MSRRGAANPLGLDASAYREVQQAWLDERDAAFQRSAGRAPAATSDTRAFLYRILLDAWNEATSTYWLRRAADFEWVLTGRRDVAPTAEQLARRPDIAQVIAACRNRATLVDASQSEYLETLTSLSAGAAA